MAEAPEEPLRRGGAPYLSHVVGDAFRELTERKLLELVETEPVPHHLAIIMDGNRRFAGERGLAVKDGHAAGRDTLEQLLDWCLELGIRVLTVYALSTENLSRSSEELEGLMDLFDKALRDIAVDERVHKHQIRVRVIGNRAILPPRIREAIDIAENATRDYTAYRYNVALAYGGRDEIVEAIRALAREVRDGKLDPEQIDSEAVSPAPLHRRPTGSRPHLPDQRGGADLELPPLAVRLHRAVLLGRAVAGAHSDGVPPGDLGVSATERRRTVTDGVLGRGRVSESPERRAGRGRRPPR